MESKCYIGIFVIFAAKTKIQREQTSLAFASNILNRFSRRMKSLGFFQATQRGKPKASIWPRSVSHKKKMQQFHYELCGKILVQIPRYISRMLSDLNDVFGNGFWQKKSQRLQNILSICPTEVWAIENATNLTPRKTASNHPLIIA